MNYQEFVGSVTGFLRESLPGGTRLQLIPLEKNNGIIMDGLSVRKEGKRVAPMIYLDSYYREYLDGRSLRGICDQILECCEDSDFEEHFDVDFFREPEPGPAPRWPIDSSIMRKTGSFYRRFPICPFLIWQWYSTAC